MDEIIKFLGESKLCFVATESNGSPYVRPQGFSMEYDNRICFCTADEKETSKQLKANSNVEIASVQGMKFIRIRGKAEFFTDAGAVKKALSIMPALEKMIRPGNLEIFCVTSGTAVIADLSTGAQTTIEI